jgi:hypothetical protein
MVLCASPPTSKQILRPGEGEPHQACEGSESDEETNAASGTAIQATARVGGMRREQATPDSSNGETGVVFDLLHQAVEAEDVVAYRRKENGRYFAHCVDGDLFPIHDAHWMTRFWRGKALSCIVVWKGFVLQTGEG